MRRFFFFYGVLPVVILTIVWLVFRPAPAVAPTDKNASNVNTTSPAVTFFTPVKTSTFASSVPENNAVIAQTPGTVSVSFRQAAGPSSSLVITDTTGMPVQLGGGSFSDDHQTLTVLLQKNVTGPLSVSYTACDLAGGCETGQFGFTVTP